MRERKRNRMFGFNYSTEAIYFLTICVHNRICHFGNIETDEMKLNEYGQITHNQIEWLEQQYPYFFLHNFVVMPNHVHILCEISVGTGRGDVGTGRDDVGTGHDDVGTGRGDVGTGRGDVGAGRGDVGTGRDLSLPIVPPKIKSISELMGAFKTTSSKKIHLTGNDDFRWQRSFHDHIVRNNKSYERIFNYINENPFKWEDDTFYNNKIAE